MTVKEIADFIILNKYFAFQVGISNSLKERQLVSDIVSKHGSLESYLIKIAELYKVSCFTVVVFSNGGTSRDKQKYKYEKEFEVEINENSKGDQENTPQLNGGNEENTPQMNGGNAENTPQLPPKQAIIPQKHTTMQDKDYIDFKVLEVKHDTLKHQHEESKSKIAKLEKKVEDLHEENKKALRDIATKDDKHELALDRVKLDNEKANSEQKESLSGVLVDTLKDPEIVKMFLQGFFPSKFLADQQAQLTGADDSVREIKYTTDTTANQVLNDIPRTLSQKNGDTIAKVYLLFQKMMSSTETFNEVMKQFVPELPTT